MNELQWRTQTEIGPLYLVATERGLRGIHWKRQAIPLAKSLRGTDAAVRMLARAERQLAEYFRGSRRKFELPLDLVGTEFQKRVWNQLRKIPYGKTLAYRDIAEKVGAAKAFRAVGTANGKNPVSIVVPCHRVIASDGTLGGYAGGLSTKTKLLRLEKNGPAKT